MTRWTCIVLAGLISLFSVAQAQISTEEATFILLEESETIRSGYLQNDWIYKEIFWIEAIECWGGRSLLGARSACLVCSIDDTAGLQDFRRNRGKPVGEILPSTAVGVQASYAYFMLRPNGWSLERYKPFSLQLYARNYEPYHRTNVRNMSQGPAQTECRDMEAVSGTE